MAKPEIHKRQVSIFEQFQFLTFVNFIITSI